MKFKKEILLLKFLLLGTLLTITAAADEIDVVEELCEPTAAPKCNCQLKISSPWGLPALIIDCRQRQLQSNTFHAELLPVLTSILDISRNELQYVPNFDGKQLRILDASRNNITVINDNNFAFLPLLEELILRNNRIESISMNAFGGLIKLLKLDLSSNNLNKLTSHLFSSLSALSHLDMSHNLKLNETFHRSHVDLYLHLGVTPKLQTLNLVDCKLEMLDIGRGYGLKSLYLGYNEFKIVPDLPRFVELLDLSGSQFQVLGPKFLPHLSGLKTLILEDIQSLEVIDDYSLFGFTNLTDISFRGCKNLRSFSDNAFGHLNVDLEVALKNMNLRGTRLSAINGTLLFVAHQLEVFDLRGIPLICDCTTVVLHELTIETGVKCVSPKQWRGALLSVVPSDELECYYYAPWFYRIMNGLLILLLLVLCGVGVWLIVTGLRPKQEKSFQRPVSITSPYGRVTIEPNRAENHY